MGYMRHHAIVVTSLDEDALKAAHALAVRWNAHPSALTDEAVNGYRSFLIPPDGSKEGWTDSNHANSLRDALIRQFRGKKEFRALEWVEVQFGDEAGHNLITRDSSQLSAVTDRVTGTYKGER